MILLDGLAEGCMVSRKWNKFYDCLIPLKVGIKVLS